MTTTTRKSNGMAEDVVTLTYSELQKLVTNALGHDPLQRGVVAYSGSATWQPGRFMIFGFNPAADGTNECLNEIVPRPPSWSLYADKCWHCGEVRGVDHRHKLTRHQKTVHALCSLIGIESPRSLFATNVIFVESKDIATLPNWRDLFEKCWEVHLRFIELVKPEWILCLGNSDGASSYSLIRGKMDIDGGVKACGKDFRDGKWFSGKVTAGQWSSKVNVLGLPHPSRFSISPSLQSFLVSHVKK
jgi:hypothetical protein